MPATISPDPSLVTPLPIVLRPDPTRTVVRPFVPSDPADYATPGHPRGERIIARLLALGEKEVHLELERVRLSLDERHRDVLPMLERRFKEVAGLVPEGAGVTPEQRVLIGAYFSAEYSFESAALFNPSVVPHPVQDTSDGATRFLFSLRGIGEGHLSSVTFRTGTWAADGSVTVDEPSPTSVPPVQETPVGWADAETIQLNCHGSRDPSETVLFPIIESQSRGIEDLRLTPFAFPDNPRSYAGTFTALGAAGVRQELLQTDDFRTFKMRPVTGKLGKAKGMALFPRPINGRYLALGRQDNENLWLFSSDDLLAWEEVGKLMGPRYPWEFVQIGNCGSPLEIDEGWLVLTHGVGVVRNYCMGAALLDRDDPSRVIARMAVPLLEPGPADRDGYVPNVVYSCGGLVRGRTLLLPYGVADEYTAFATVDIDRLLAAMVPG
ncbi:glycoside hydrolase family 130 protein [Sphingomonas rubra]|uniref:Predicted glycosyl hydrolase, GH43/DUF377 family n=1 Tax=Sphingomonas rubra TaxID=634430 RepID=A0A1I5S138_9SPHN|nr:glycoside hydrolase family 130 protein [Sphingomonas rubra]SFP64460.1 Predicted glycosyl hydrolase, GH43/DUF377 family [Sphingomonas rubra]